MRLLKGHDDLVQHNQQLYTLGASRIPEKSGRIAEFNQLLVFFKDMAAVKKEKLSTAVMHIHFTVVPCSVGVRGSALPPGRRYCRLVRNQK